MNRQSLGVLVAGAWLVQLVYTVLPIDLIPDVIPLLGWIDDLALLGGAVAVTGVAVHLVRSHARNPELDDRSRYEPVTPEEIRKL